MQELKDRLYRNHYFTNFICPEKPGDHIQLTGLKGSLKAAFLAYLIEQLKKRIILLTADVDFAERIRDDLELFLDEKLVSFFPNAEMTAYEEQDLNPSLIRLRLETQLKLLNNESGIVVATADGLLNKVTSPEKFIDRQFHIKQGMHQEFNGLVKGLSEAGFRREDAVEEVGQFAVRGGLIDVYPWTSEDPLRIEFFGNQIESIRTFNVISQRSIEDAKSVVILPHPDDRDLVSIFDYFDDQLLVFDDFRLFMQTCKDHLTLFTAAYEKHIENNIFPLPPEKKYLMVAEIKNSIGNYPACHFDLVTDRSKPIYDVPSTLPPTFAGHLGRFFAYLKNARKEDNRIIIQFDSKPQQERFLEIIEEEGIEDVATLMVGALHNGFIFPDEKLHVITDHEIFDRFKKRRTYKRFRSGEYLRSLNALNVNDYVVHIDYGIGQYKGLETITSGKYKRECIKVVYQDNDTLFVSVDRLNRVQKYASEEQVLPKLTKLGTGEWDRVKKRTRESIEKMAAELIQVNAARKVHQGVGFSNDTHWQKELEASFPFEETEDQLRSIVEVKKNLEETTPMDRLLCGDVGYGKTEVALRAAFKVIMDGKQVAVLVPTTILAHQHYQTFLERMGGFPINIEMLSRFRTTRQQNEVLKKLSAGEIDIVIGTHRLLSEDVVFKDMGLLIIDEEQRFGVRHKEKLKKMRIGVDVLTMSATPIPRTLHLSLMGARDLSHIETPPRNRLPVITEIHEWDDDLIRIAINREMSRNGQVYFVHNRVNTITAIKNILSEIVPHARVAIAHGQLPERELETIMMDFIHKKYDVLLATMIIENGLDIPNVNTIIIDHAEKFGLAQLYQLRGRVGRSTEQAYAYLLIPSTSRLTGLAQKRLRAIQDFTDLGSGFKVALRDMEIRGIGNILGKEQSGNMQAVGFDLYCRLLDESVTALKRSVDAEQVEIPATTRTDPKLDVDFDLYIPREYVSSDTERMTVYHRMVNFTTLEELENMKEELTDRFGPVPGSIILLIDAIELKILAGNILASRLTLKDDLLKLSFSEQVKEDDYFFKQILPVLMNFKKTEVKFLGDDTNLSIKLRLKGQDKKEQLLNAKTLLKSIV